MSLAAGGRPAIDLRAIFRLAGPLMLTNAVQAILNLTDTWFLGRLSTEAVAAMGAIYWIMTCAILLFGGVGMAVQTFVAQAVGSRRNARASQSVWTALWASLATAPLFVLLALGGPALLAPFGLDPHIEQLALEYWMPRMYGGPLALAFWAAAGFFNGIGATRVTLGLALVVTIANVPANQILMFEFGLGMAGAAWGTNVAQAVGLLCALAVLLSSRYAVAYRSRLTWRPRLSLLRRQLAVGGPVGVMYGADVLGLALFQLMIARVGASAAAATQVVIMLTSLAYLPGIGLATAATTFVGQSLGARDKALARQVGSRVILLCGAFMFVMAMLLITSASWLLPVFLSEETLSGREAISIALVILWPAAAYQVFDGLYFGSASALRGAGDTTVPALTALGLSWLLFVPLAHMLIYAPGEGLVPGLPQAGLGAIGGWIALMTYATLLGTSMLLRWRSGRWLALKPV